jgi:hypothetical protein
MISVDVLLTMSAQVSTLPMIRDADFPSLCLPYLYMGIFCIRFDSARYLLTLFCTGVHVV